MLLEIISTGICGSDKHMYMGNAKLEFPVVAGHELVGRVVDMGDDVATASNVVGGPVAVGDRVAVTPSTLGCGRCWYCQHVPHKPALCPNRMVYGFTPASREPHLFGGFAQLMFVGPKSNIFRIPDDLSTARAVLTEPAAVATRAVERAMGGGIPHVGEGLSIGKRTAVLGAGPIGLLTVVALRHAGAGTIIVTDASAPRLALARRMGADITLNLTETDSDARLAAVRDATDGVGPDVVIEAAGVPAAFEEALAMVRRGGRLVEVGHYFDSGAIELKPHTVCQKEVDILGVWAYPPIQFETALALLQRSAAPLEELLSATLPLAQLEAGLQLTGSEETIKVVIDPGA
jgi:L-iditol 2-dehydrogenase